MEALGYIVLFLMGGWALFVCTIILCLWGRGGFEDILDAIGLAIIVLILWACGFTWWVLV
ncbi:MAG: hypothetical protein IT544_00460 [Rhodobacteraceae bacterium]|nr:hypothetical protein [Paracoccaceae bacterium]